MGLQKIPRSQRKGLLIVYTGDGKGKTTAALGMVVRAVGYDWRVLMVQFIKGDWSYGELEGYKRLQPNFELYRMGRGFVRIMGDKKPIEDHIRAARETLDFVKAHLKDDFDIIILDEVNIAIKEGLVSAKEVLEVANARPSYLHIVLTGRNAPPEIIEAADLVTEMTEIKHPFQQGILAQPGVDY
ncbi:MAG TPA: cob(I)yrinic acid a,c-diamide adenosyltransferase [Caldithrix sp.]|nr:cob(I)yrinic acid a,c-diamide adenosyltransferase [Caldithrix sp.]